MKKTIVLFIIAIFASGASFAETEFTRALSNCSNFIQEGSIPYEGHIFNVKVTLQKAKGDKCLYKERIYQDIGYEEMVCNFNKEQLKSITVSMIEYSNKYKKELLKNRIFEAKMSTNPDVLQNYLVEPQLCKINYLKKK